VQDCNNLNNDYCYGTEIKHDDYTCDNANCILDETTLIQDCDNGQYCDGEETCADAACVAGTPIDCSDGVGCTMDSCNEETDSCDNTPDDSYCDDGLWCNGFETCDALDDCQAGTEVDCSDGVDCTLDSCNEQTDSCENNPDNTICDDGLFCNGIETCDALDDCQDGTPIDCSANNILGIETCDNIPDDYHPTWDYREAFISVCEEPGTCTTGDETIIHTCDYDTCGAECDATHSCLDTDCDNLDGCVGNDYYDYDDVPNDCLCDCNCEANTCGAPIEISYNDTRCVECNVSEKSKVCINETHAEVAYQWNYDTCGEPYNETKEDETCGCEYTCWEDDTCVDDGFMRQIRYETTEFEYCEDTQYQEIENSDCDCESEETSQECVSDGYAEVTYEWNYAYCGCSYTETVEDELCLCDYTEWTDDECVSDGYLRQTRTELSGYTYCTGELERTVEYPCCSCKYTEWQDFECVEDGIMRQIKTETTDFDYCEDEQYREVQNEACDCEAEETGRECVSDGYADLTYEWNYAYCGESYTGTVEDESCLCDYTEWQDDECVEDGIMKQIRNESSGHDYCDADLIREIEYTMCDCISSEISRECVANVTALVNYSWNYQYCGPDSEYVYDESCLMCTPNWICIEYSECTSENYQYCTQVQDTHSCGECYTEDYSEFTKECDYCGIHGPKIITDDTITVIEGDLVEIEFEVTDPDSTQLTYSISAPVGNDKQWQTQEGDKGEYNVLITVSDGICTAAKTVKIIVKAESQQSLIIKRTNYKEFIKPGQTQELFVTLENTGNENFEDLKITAFIDSLGIWKTTRKFDLKKGQETTKLIDFIIPSYAPKGRHYIRIVVSNDNIRRVIYRDFDVV